MYCIGDKLEMSKEYLHRRLDEIAAEHVLNPRPLPKPKWWQLKPLEKQRLMDEENERLAVEYCQHIYVIPAGRIVKIGVSNNVNVRWRSLRTSNPLVEPPIFVSQKLLNATAIESAVHRRLVAYRISSSTGREWFKCSRYLAVEIVKELVEKS